MTLTLNADGQPYAVGFNRSRNIDKATYVLNGIIDGVQSDGKLTDSEIMYMDVWMKSQKNLNLEADTLDLFQAVKHVLEEREISQEARADLHQLIKDILKYGPSDDKSGNEPRINQFIGLLKGICADGNIVRSEIRRVESWIAVNKDVADMFPIKPVHERLCKVLADDKISDEELTDLSDLLSEIAGDKFKETGDVDGSIGEVFCDDVRRFSFQGKFVCFTGKFLVGTRKQCMADAETLGASVKSSVTSELDVLVVGAVTSRDWRFQNFGRKIERAMSLRMDYGSPTILSERQWVGFLSESGYLTS